MSCFAWKKKKQFVPPADDDGYHKLTVNRVTVNRSFTVMEPGLQYLGPDPFLESPYVVGLDPGSLKPFVNAKDAALIMFYSPFKKESSAIGKHFSKAAKHPVKPSHGYGAFDCNKYNDVCRKEQVDVLPHFRVYVGGNIFQNYKNNPQYDYIAMKQWMEAVKNVDTPGYKADTAADNIYEDIDTATYERDHEYEYVQSPKQKTASKSYDNRMYDNIYEGSGGKEDNENIYGPLPSRKPSAGGRSSPRRSVGDDSGYEDAAPSHSKRDDRVYANVTPYQSQGEDSVYEEVVPRKPFDQSKPLPPIPPSSPRKKAYNDDDDMYDVPPYRPGQDDNIYDVPPHRPGQDDNIYDVPPYRSQQEDNIYDVPPRRSQEDDIYENVGPYKSPVLPPKPPLAPKPQPPPPLPPKRRN